MSRDSSVKIDAAGDEFSFSTGTRDLCDCLDMKLHESKVWEGEEALTLMRSPAWKNNVPEHYRDIVLKVTRFVREQPERGVTIKIFYWG